MPQPNKNSKHIGTRINEDKLTALSAFVVGMGYCYERDGASLPAWGAFLEAIADGEIIIYKKVTPLPCTSNETDIQL